MVVSGLPIRIGPNHAEEISMMALHLLDAAKKDFVVRHKPDYKLNLRTGIHSGKWSELFRYKRTVESLLSGHPLLSGK